MAKTKVTEEWQYQFIDSRGKKRWIPEDDKYSAEWKASKSPDSTGKVRFRTVKTKTTKWKKGSVVNGDVL